MFSSYFTEKLQSKAFLDVSRKFLCMELTDPKKTIHCIISIAQDFPVRSYTCHMAHKNIHTSADSLHVFILHALMLC